MKPSVAFGKMPLNIRHLAKATRFKVLDADQKWGKKNRKEQNLAVVGHARLVFVPPRNESVLCSVVQKETPWLGIPS
jgi:hypothetical protein